MSKVRVKGSYGQGYCSITLKHNYVSSERLLGTLAIDCSLYFASVQHFCVFAPPPQKKRKKKRIVEQSEAKMEGTIRRDIPGWYSLYSVSAFRIWHEMTIIGFGCESDDRHCEEKQRFTVCQRNRHQDNMVCFSFLFFAADEKKITDILYLCVYLRLMRLNGTIALLWF